MKKPFVCSSVLCNEEINSYVPNLHESPIILPTGHICQSPIHQFKSKILLSQHIISYYDALKDTSRGLEMLIQHILNRISIWKGSARILRWGGPLDLSIPGWEDHKGLLPRVQRWSYNVTATLTFLFGWMLWNRIADDWGQVLWKNCQFRCVFEKFISKS